MKNVANKVVLVTGASSGIGHSTATLLLKNNATVYAVARRLDKMKDLKGLGAITLALDITQQADIDRVVHTIIQDHQRIDVLINNAGYGSYGAVEDVPLDEARKQFEVNLFGLAALTQAVLPHMRQNKSGTVVNISSMGGKIYMPMAAWYHASKHALEGWSDALRLEVKPFGIQVVIIEPGAIHSEWANIANQHNLTYSAQSAYAPLARRMNNTLNRTYKKGKASPPEVIAQVIVKALKSQAPKTRYAAGYMSKFSLFFRWLLTDGMFDKIMTTQIK